MKIHFYKRALIAAVALGLLPANLFSWDLPIVGIGICEIYTGLKIHAPGQTITLNYYNNWYGVLKDVKEDSSLTFMFEYPGVPFLGQSYGRGNFSLKEKDGKTRFKWAIEPEAKAAGALMILGDLDDPSKIEVGFKKAKGKKGTTRFMHREGVIPEVAKSCKLTGACQKRAY